MRPTARPAALAHRRTRTSFHRYLRAAILLGALACPVHLLADSAAGNSRTYKLQPGDHITVTVFNQPELSADAVIDGAGNIVLPFLEPLAVRNLTILQCQALIRDRLANGILQRPSVSVRIAELRPIYVSGDVRTPGAYPFRPGSTVQSAVAVAGGYGPTDLVQTASTAEFLLADERVRQLTLQKQTLLVRQTRLEAQLAGADTFSPSAPPGPMTGPDIAGVIANEKETFDTQAAILRGQLNLLRSQKPRLEKEIDALHQQIVTGTKQLDLIKQQIDRYDRLVKQGLGTQTADFQFRVIEANQEDSLWRLKAGISRLQMEAGELDLKIAEAQASFKRQTVAELREVRDRLNELDVTLPAAREIRNVRLQYAGSFIGFGITRSIIVTRVRDGEAAAFDATEITPLEPGDIVDVRKLLPRQESNKKVSAAQIDLPVRREEASRAAEPLDGIAR
jgi:polysaccharide export outer membrane protein